MMCTEGYVFEIGRNRSTNVAVMQHTIHHFDIMSLLISTKMSNMGQGVAL